MKQINYKGKLLYFTTEDGLFHWALSHNFHLYIKYRKNIPYMCYSGTKKELEDMVQAYILNEKLGKKFDEEKLGSSGGTSPMVAVGATSR